MISARFVQDRLQSAIPNVWVTPTMHGSQGPKEVYIVVNDSKRLVNWSRYLRLDRPSADVLDDLTEIIATYELERKDLDRQIEVLQQKRMTGI